MRTSSPSVPLVSSLIAAALALAPVSVVSAAPSGSDDASAEDDAPKAEDEADPEEEAPEGEEGEDAAEGEDGEDAAEGEDGEEPEGEEGEEAAEGEGEDGEEAAEGEGEDGEEAAAEGEGEDGEEAAAEGEGEDGEEAAAAEGEGEETTPSFLDDGDGRPPEPRIANKPATGKGLMIAGGSVAGVGLGLTIAFTLMTRNCSFDGPLACGLQDQDDFLIPLGGATLLTGTMLLAVGVGYHLKYKRWEKWSPEDDKKAMLIPTPTAMRSGGGLMWSGRF